jgi:uncharacterized membrane protein YkvI
MSQIIIFLIVLICTTLSFVKLLSFHFCVTYFMFILIFRLLSDQEKLTSKRNSVESRYKSIDAEKIDLEQQLNQQVTRRRHFEDNIR